MSKEMWIAAHEQLVEERLEELYPDGDYSPADEMEVESWASEIAHERMVDNACAQADWMRDRMKGN
jgi:hypothetical protein